MPQMTINTDIAGAMVITEDGIHGMGEVTIINSIVQVLSAGDTCDARALMIPGPAGMRTMENTRTIEVITTNRQFERSSATCATPAKTYGTAAENYGATSRN
jgi:hypothetical protein